MLQGSSADGMQNSSPLQSSSRALVSRHREDAQDADDTLNGVAADAGAAEWEPESLPSGRHTPPPSSLASLGLGPSVSGGAAVRKLGLKGMAGNAPSRHASAVVAGAGSAAPLSPVARLAFGLGGVAPSVGGPGSRASSPAQAPFSLSRRGSSASHLLERSLHTESPTPSPIDFTARARIAQQQQQQQQAEEEMGDTLPAAAPLPSPSRPKGFNSSPSRSRPSSALRAGAGGGSGSPGARTASPSASRAAGLSSRAKVSSLANLPFRNE